MRVPCLPDLSEHDVKKVPEDSYRKPDAAFSELTGYRTKIATSEIENSGRMSNLVFQL